MLTFEGVPVVDHHCHPYDPQKASLEPVELARVFFHGMGDIPTEAPKPRHWGASPELEDHFLHMGVVGTLLCQMAALLKCPADLKAVTEARNRISSKDFGSYIEMLYGDASITATVLDTGLAADDPLLAMIPGTKLRLFQFEPALHKHLEKSGSYQELLQAFQDDLGAAVSRHGFVGVKVHLAEQIGFGFNFSDVEAAPLYARAQSGEKEAFKVLYGTVFLETMLQCQDLDIPVHLHSGFTGGLWQGPIASADPFLLAPLLRRPEFLKTRVILLHAGYPWTKQAGQMAHTFPHLWVDMGQVSPWASLRLAECYRDVMAWAPLSKIVIGSGGHGSPEIAWLAAKTAKIALAEVLGDAVRMKLLSEEYAVAAGRMILSGNAARLYGLDNV